MEVREPSTLLARAQALPAEGEDTSSDAQISLGGDPVIIVEPSRPFSPWQALRRARQDTADPVVVLVCMASTKRLP